MQEVAAGKAASPSVAGHLGTDAERMDAVGHPVGDGIIHQPVSANGGQSGKHRRDQRDGKMPGPASGAGVASMMMAVVLNGNVGVGKMLFQTLQECSRRWFHRTGLPGCIG